MSILVITPTTGSSELRDAVISVANQSIDVDHLLVCDGPQFQKQVEDVLAHISTSMLKNVHVCSLPYNTGGNGFYGHRVMAGFPHMVNHEYILFLDQDNWYEPVHVERLYKTIVSKKLDWAYSLRKIYDKDREFICEDNCESLGRWPAWVGDDVFLVDSSTYCFKTEFLKQVCHLWHWGWGADRRFYSILKQADTKYACTGEYTLCYRLGGNEGSVTAGFFKQGNQVMLNRYYGDYPWCKGS